MSADFASWTMAGSASDFSLVTINRQHVVMAQRVGHGKNGVAVSFALASAPLTLTATFDEFDAWLKAEPQP